MPGDMVDEEVSASPTAALRRKMLQQRQRGLDRHRSRVDLVASNMIQASGVPTLEAVMTSSCACQPNGRPSSAASTSASSNDEMSPTRRARSMRGSLDRRASSASLSDDMGDQVVPELGIGVHRQRRKDRARTGPVCRRGLVAQELNQRGIAPEFDPSALPGNWLPGPGRSLTSTLPIDAMKAFLLNPLPKDAGMMECRVIRERSGHGMLYPRYTMESDAGVFFMTAKKKRRNRTSNHSISASRTAFGTTRTADVEDPDYLLGKLRSNFLGLDFIAYGNGLNPKKIDGSMPTVHATQLARQEMATVQYSSSLLGRVTPQGPRRLSSAPPSTVTKFTPLARMNVAIPKVQPSGERVTRRTLQPESDGLLSLSKQGGEGSIDCYTNRPPKWNEELGAFVLNFQKRVTQASVKNFQLASTQDLDDVALQFGRVGKDVFHLDFRYPFSPYQAFAICLSSFDYKLFSQ